MYYDAREQPEGDRVKRLLYIINEVSLGWLLAALVCTVLAFGVGYWFLAAQGALVFTYDTAARPGLLDALYFSIVTISSLGYGDIRPMGWARVLVGMEVTIGLAFLGLLVAKISSVKQDYILRRMYSDVVDDKLAKYSEQLAEGVKLYRLTSQMLIRGEIDPELTTTFRASAGGLTFFAQFRQLLTDVRDLMVFETHNGGLFGDVADSRIEQVYESVRSALDHTVQMYGRTPSEACEHVLGGNAEDLARICELADEIAVLGRRRSKNRDIMGECDAICSLVEQVRREVLPAI